MADCHLRVGCHQRWDYLAIGCPLGGDRRKEYPERTRGPPKKQIIIIFSDLLSLKTFCTVLVLLQKSKIIYDLGLERYAYPGTKQYSQFLLRKGEVV
jgi:hypothetical protein